MSPFCNNFFSCLDKGMHRQVRPAEAPFNTGDHRVTDIDQVFARFSTFDAPELQPFGTSTLQELLVLLRVVSACWG
jgi:hypothetical protein